MLHSLVKNILYYGPIFKKVFTIELPVSYFQYLELNENNFISGNILKKI